MAREKIISEFSPGRNNNLYRYTKGNEFSLNGVNYIGEYHYIGNTPKTGPTPSNQSQELRRIYNNFDHYVYDRAFDFDVNVLTYVDPIPYLYKPTEQAYAVGIDDRFFVEKIQDDISYAIEIDSTQFKFVNKRGGIDGAIYRAAILKWKLTGKREDIISYNQSSIARTSTIVPSVNYAIKNFLEFARITLV